MLIYNHVTYFHIPLELNRWAVVYINEVEEAAIIVVPPPVERLHDERLQGHLL